MKLLYEIIERKKWIQNRVCLHTYGLSTTCFLFLTESERRGKRNREKSVKINFCNVLYCREKRRKSESLIWIIGKRLVLWKERGDNELRFWQNEPKVIKSDVRFPNTIWKSYSRGKS